MKLLAVGLLLLGLVIFGFCFAYDYSWVSRQNPFLKPRPRGNSEYTKDYDFWLYPNDSGVNLTKKRLSEYNSIRGLSRLTDLKINVIVLGTTGATTDFSAPFRVYENISVKSAKPNDGWSETISVGETTQSKMNTNLEIILDSLPKDDDLWGRDARFVITGKYNYPLKTGDKEFSVKTTPEFREEIPFRFANRAEKEKYEAANQLYEQEKAKVDLFNYRAGWFYFLSRLFGFILSLGLIVSSIWLFRRARR